VLHLYNADQVGPLAARLGKVLAEPPPDPMTPDWVAVPSSGMRRWLALELARSLGASNPDSGDGIAANIEFGFPGTLRQTVLDAGRGGKAPDPWQVEQLVWAVLDVLHSGLSDDRLGPLTSLPAGATWYGRARRLADLFDRYAVRRSDLVRQWRSGNDVDALGRPLGDHDSWQPHLWRLVRERIDQPSPVERLPELLDALRIGTLALDLPDRLAVFGVTTLPNGAPFMELVQALAAQRDVHIFLLDPSPSTANRVRTTTLAASAFSPLRADDHSDDEVLHPLLQSWGRPYRERAMLLAEAESRGVPQSQSVETVGPVGTRASLLARIQSDLRADRAPAGDLELNADDRSIQFHSCHGQARQVEVLRDAILHLLADDPTLREEDIVVLCPSIEQFAPLVEAGFGTSAEVTGPIPVEAIPRLLYRIADRSLRDSYPMLSALETLLELISGRCTASAMLEFISLSAVRECFDFDDDALGTIADWIATANVRWGFDGEHRTSWGVSPGLTANTWRAALDRVLMGVAVSDDDIDLAPSGIAPLGVEGSDIALAGRFADVVTRLAVIADDMTNNRTVAQWCETLVEASTQLFDAEPEKKWQVEQLRRTIGAIGDGAVVADEPTMTELTLADVRRLLADRFRGKSGRPDFYRGGITVTSLTPLRWLPFRVVCLLGFDEAGTSPGPGAADGDDLAAQSPYLGDPDPRSEVRQALLEAVLAAGDHVVVTRTGHNVRTNQEVPGAVAFAELRDSVMATLSPGSVHTYGERIETIHPRQPFDDRCFQPGALDQPGPWSFDPGALAGAYARSDRQGTIAPLMTEPLPPTDHEEQVITLSDLQAFFKHPVKAFLRRRLRLHLPSDDAIPSDNMLTELDGLESWSLGDDLIAARLGGHSNAQWERYTRALGALPTGGLGDAKVVDVEGGVDALLAEAAARGVDPAKKGASYPIDVKLDDGTRIVGTIEGHCAPPDPGPALLTYSKVSPKQTVAAWLDLMALVAVDPEVNWRSVVVRRSRKTDGPPDVLELVGSGASPDERRRRALDALGVMVDCYRRGLREPIPLFAKLSHRLYLGEAKAKDWSDGRMGDGDDEANKLAFGHLDFRELCEEPASEHDPLGSRPGRADRFACYLWDAIAASSEERR
jgi:exodeoxyribonuclease V gamma subunit